jgi:hypothetical protein
MSTCVCLISKNLLNINVRTFEEYVTYHTIRNLRFRIVFWDVLPCKIIVDIPEENSEHHTRRRQNLKSHIRNLFLSGFFMIKI